MWVVGLTGLTLIGLSIESRYNEIQLSPGVAASPVILPIYWVSGALLAIAGLILLTTFRRKNGS